MKIDRALQRQILKVLADAYPDPVNPPAAVLGADKETVMANLLYLQEHGLVHANVTETLNGRFQGFPPKITARGIDFIAGDGGLTAILGVVTIKIHDDTLKRLIEAKVEASDLPSEKKRKLLDHLRSLSSESLSRVGSWLVEKGIEHIPDVADSLESLVSGL